MIRNGILRRAADLRPQYCLINHSGPLKLIHSVCTVGGRRQVNICPAFAIEVEEPPEPETATTTESA